MVIAEEDMHPAVQLLLARMRTDPEEFVRSTRWEKVLAQTRELVQPHERKTLEEAYRLIRLDAVHVQIMKILTDAEDDDGYDINADTTAQDRLDAIRLQQEMAMKQQALRAGTAPNALGSVVVGGGGGGGGAGGYLSGIGGMGHMGGYADALQNANQYQAHQEYERMQLEMQRQMRIAKAEPSAPFSERLGFGKLFK